MGEYRPVALMSNSIPAPLKRQRLDSCPLAEEVANLIKPYPGLDEVTVYPVVGHVFADAASVTAAMSTLIQQLADSANPTNDTGILDVNNVHVDMRKDMLRIVIGLIGVPNCAHLESYGALN